MPCSDAIALHLQRQRAVASAQRRRAPAHRPRALRGRCAAAGDAARGVRAQRLRARAAEERRRRRPRAHATGVVAVYTADDLGDYWHAGPLLVPRRRFRASCFTAARSCRSRRTRCATSASRIAMIVAESRYIAEDAHSRRRRRHRAASTRSSISKRRMKPGAPLVHEHLSSNAAAHVVQRKGDYAAARANADPSSGGVSSTTAACRRAIENRAVAVDWDPRPKN